MTLIVGIAGFQVSDAEAQILAHSLISGVILFTRNFRDKAQLQALCQQLHQIKPYFKIYVDQEGGRVQRFRDGFSNLLALGIFGDQYMQDPKQALHDAKAVGYLMAHELLSAGVDQSFAPVVDLNVQSRVIGMRAFSADPEIVVALASQYIDGMADAGMPAVLKHFPGHGSVIPDTHVDFAIDDRRLTEIEKTDLVPFKYLLQHPNVMGVMVAHVIYQHVDAQPASLSSYWLKDYLRQHLGFRGKVFSDDLDMKAVSTLGGAVEVTRRALDAGCDYVLLCNDWQAVVQVVGVL